MDKKAKPETGSAGLTETQYFTFAYPPEPFVTEGGEKLGPVTLAYETYGKLNGDKSNAILILHALSGDAHAAGFHRGEDKPGWWDEMIGPEKAFDTKQYFVICSNVLGGCKGSTGPSSVNPGTKEPYGLSFPLITIKDMTAAQKRLIEYLGIDRLLAVAGGSMGGMQVLEWMRSYPEMICGAIPVATSLKHSSQQIAFNEVGRQAIMADPNWNNGNYYGGILPTGGLGIARMVGHITYMSEDSMENKFGRRFRIDRGGLKFSPDFEVEGYLQNRSNNFVKRFDANSYLYVTKAIDYFDLSIDRKPGEIFNGLKAQVLVIAFKSDWLYPASQSKGIVKACKLSGVDVTYCEIDANYGHDSFLVETGEESHLVKYFLRRLAETKSQEAYEF